MPVGWSRPSQRRRRRRFATARCGLGAYRRRLPLIVLNLDNDDLGSQRGSPSGRAATDHSRRPDRAGRRLGYLGDVPLVGRDYESAIISGAFCGFAMGATATAIANMQALTGRHAPSPQAFVIVPIVGAFFIDLINLAVLTFYLWPGFIIGR